MIYKLVTNVLGVLLALVTLDLAAAPSSIGMVYTVNSPVPLLLKWVPGGQFRMGDLAGVGQADEYPPDNGEPLPLIAGSGVLELHPNGYGFLRNPATNFTRERTDPFSRCR